MVSITNAFNTAYITAKANMTTLLPIQSSTDVNSVDNVHID